MATDPDNDPNKIVATFNVPRGATGESQCYKTADGTVWREVMFPNTGTGVRAAQRYGDRVIPRR